MIVCEFCDHFACFKMFDEDWEEDVYLCKCCYNKGGVCGAREIFSQTIVRV